MNATNHQQTIRKTNPESTVHAISQDHSNHWIHWQDWPTYTRRHQKKHPKRLCKGPNGFHKQSAKWLDSKVAQYHTSHSWPPGRLSCWLVVWFMWLPHVISQIVDTHSLKRHAFLCIKRKDEVFLSMSQKKGRTYEQRPCIASYRDKYPNKYCRIYQVVWPNIIQIMSDTLIPWKSGVLRILSLCPWTVAPLVPP